jgi:integrase
MSIRKRVLPSGETRWLVDYKDSAGHRRARQFPTKAAAIGYNDKVRGELRAGTHTPDSASITVAQAAEMWLRRGEANGLEPSTVRGYGEHVRLHIVPLIGAARLSRLTKPDIERFIDRLLVDRSRPLARHVLMSLKSLIDEAERRGLVAHNPTHKCTIRMSKRDRADLPILTKSQLQAVLAKATAMFPLVKVQPNRAHKVKTTPICWRPLLHTAAFTGMRSSELRGLTWGHVDLQRGIAKIRQRADYRGVMGRPKSAAGVRDIPLPATLIRELKEWRLACPTTALDLVFPNQAGGVVSACSLHKFFWVPLLQAAGVPHVRFHSLRALYATSLIEAGWSVKRTQEVLGHSDASTTLNVYAKAWHDAEGDAAAIAKVEALLRS